MTDMKCSLKFLGWENRFKTRESAWRDNKGNSILFQDSQIVLRLNGTIEKYPYINTDLEILMNKIMKTVENGQQPISSNVELDPFGLPK